jgi:hypothetical protein
LHAVEPVLHGCGQVGGGADGKVARLPFIVDQTFSTGLSSGA